MLTNATNSSDLQQERTSAYIVWAMLLVGLGISVFVFYDGLEIMVSGWDREEYSHGYMIPLVSG